MHSPSSPSAAPRVSVLLPVYNGARYLAGALRSVVAQSFPDWELLVVDDGSTDDSRAVAHSWDDPRIRVLANGENLGVARSLNRGIREARGDFIARMDADDECFPERLREQVRFLERHRSVCLLGTNAVSAETGKATFRVPANHASIRCNLLFNCSFLHPSVMWRRDVFQRYELWYEESPTAEDYDLWERTVQVLQTANLPQPLLRYRDDPAVKVSAYVRQQKRGGRAVRQRALARLSLEPTPEEEETHHACCFDNWKQPAIQVERVDRWLGRILVANRERQLLDPAALYRRLHLQRAYHLAKNRPPFTFRDCLRAHGPLGTVPLRFAANLLRKRIQRPAVRGQGSEVKEV